MSAFNDIDATCVDCAEDFRATVWTAIHAKEDPELKDLMQGGELNLLICPQCGHLFFYESFLLYQDPTEEVIAYVYPELERGNREPLEKMMLQGFEEAQAVFEKDQRLSYKPMIFFGLETLLEFLTGEEEVVEQSDIAQAVCIEAKIPFYSLTPSQARRRNTPRTLPRERLDTASPTRDEVLQGLKKLIDINPMLTLYQDLQKFIQDTPGWTLG